MATPTLPRHDALTTLGASRLSKHCNRSAFSWLGGWRLPRGEYLDLETMPDYLKRDIGIVDCKLSPADRSAPASVSPPWVFVGV